MDIHMVSQQQYQSEEEPNIQTPEGTNPYSLNQYKSVFGNTSPFGLLQAQQQLLVNCTSVFGNVSPFGFFRHNTTTSFWASSGTTQQLV